MHNSMLISSPAPESFVSAFEAGDFVKLHPSTVLRLAREGVLPGHPVGNGKRRRWRFYYPNYSPGFPHNRGSDFPANEPSIRSRQTRCQTP